MAQGASRTPARRSKRQSPKRVRKPRHQPRGADLSNLFSEPYDAPFGRLRVQAEAELVDTVNEAEAKLDRLIRGSFRVVDGGKS
jgi:hypothetical protein